MPVGALNKNDSGPKDIFYESQFVSEQKLAGCSMLGKQSQHQQRQRRMMWQRKFPVKTLRSFVEENTSFLSFFFLSSMLVLGHQDWKRREKCFFLLDLMLPGNKKGPEVILICFEKLHHLLLFRSLFPPSPLKQGQSLIYMDNKAHTSLYRLCLFLHSH